MTTKPEAIAQIEAAIELCDKSVEVRAWNAAQASYREAVKQCVP